MAGNTHSDVLTGGDGPFTVSWESLTKEKIDSATVCYKKVKDNSTVKVVLVRERIKENSLKFKFLLLSPEEANSKLNQQNLQLMIITTLNDKQDHGKEAVWSEIKPEERTLPGNQLDVNMPVGMGKTFIGATENDEIGVVKYESSEWRVKPYNTSVRRILCLK